MAMIIYFIRVLTEYFSIVLCLHKIADKKVKINLNLFIWLSINMTLVYWLEYNEQFSILIYLYWFIYARANISNNFKDTLKPYVIMVILIPMLQLIFYEVLAYFVRVLIKNDISIAMVEILINIAICIIILLWKKRYIYDLGIRLKSFNKFAVFFLLVGIVIYIIYSFKNDDALLAQLIQQIVICLVVWGLTIILLESAEMEKKHKSEELKLYEQYTGVFEDALTVIKMKQHEFDNHINAIKCMQYVIEDKEELIKEQQEYCDYIIKENRFNKVLMLKIPPILSGYLYSKFTLTEEKGIQIIYEIQEIKDIGVVIRMNDLIEIIGILFDNAVEELIDKSKKRIRISLLNDNKKFIIDVSNESSKITNVEIEKFFVQGYSTKGENRGIGLFRLNSLKKKYKAEIYVENINIEEVNYLRFRIIFSKNKKRSH